MVKAIPINSKRQPTGPARSFEDRQWEKMQRHFGKTLAWEQVEDSTPILNKVNAKELVLIADTTKVSTKKAFKFETKKPNS